MSCGVEFKDRDNDIARSTGLIFLKKIIPLIKLKWKVDEIVITRMWNASPTYFSWFPIYTLLDEDKMLKYVDVQFPSDLTKWSMCMRYNFIVICGGSTETKEIFGDSFKWSTDMKRNEIVHTREIFGDLFESIYAICNKMTMKSRIIDGHFVEIEQDEKGRRRLVNFFDEKGRNCIMGEGQVDGWKAAGVGDESNPKFVFVELRVPENAERVTPIPTGNYKFIAKSRVTKAKTLQIVDEDGKEYKEAFSCLR